MKRIYYPIVMFLPYFVVAIMWLLSLGGPVKKDDDYTLFINKTVQRCVSLLNESKRTKQLTGGTALSPVFFNLQ